LSNNLSAKDTANYGTTEDDKINDKINDKLSDKLSDKLISFIENNSKATLEEMAMYMGVSVRVIRYRLKKMIDSGKVIRVGARKNGYWKVNI
jgi:predicted HTH transcriptional regulator